MLHDLPRPGPSTASETRLAIARDRGKGRKEELLLVGMGGLKTPETDGGEWLTILGTH